MRVLISLVWFGAAFVCGAPAYAADALPPLRVDPTLLGKPALEKSVGVPTSTPPPSQPRPPQVAPATPASAALSPAPPPLDTPAMSATPKASEAGDKETRPPVPAQVPQPVAAPKTDRTPADSTTAPSTSQPLAPKATTATPPAATTDTAGSSAAAAADAPRALPPVEPRADAESRPAERDPLPRLGLKPALALTPLPRVSNDERPTFLLGEEIRGRTDDIAVVKGDAELRRIGSTLTANEITYLPPTDEVRARGHVVLTQEKDVISGPELAMQLSRREGYFLNPTYLISRPPKPGSPRGASNAYGTAARIDFEGPDVEKLTNATYSTCGPNDPDWYAKVSELRLDHDREIGQGSNGTIWFMDVPVLYAPSLSFSLNSQRSSGFLTPSFSTSESKGLDFSLPYYWNIAPNMDATIAPRMISKRGIAMNGEFRYLDQRYNGIARLEVMPNDRVFGEGRNAFSLIHTQTLAPGWTGSLNLNSASDRTYYSDLASRLTSTSQAYLLRQGVLSYGSTWWGASLNMQRYQPLLNSAEAYALLPQLTVYANRPEFVYGSSFNLTGGFSRFSHSTAVNAARTVLYPQISLPLESQAFYVTPKLGLHLTRYNLSQQAAGVPDQITRNLPILSVDSGVVFERDTAWGGRTLTQTLEPRLFYVYAPRKDQSQIPVFDSGLAEFNFAQIFSENRFVGSDRIGDANQLTAAVVSRLIDPQSGAELLRGALAQRYYFRDQEVTLPGVAARTDRVADLLAALSGTLLRDTTMDLAWQYNPREARTERYTIAARWHPGPTRILSASYRYYRDILRDLDLTAQWPLGSGWYGVGRYNYSVKDKRVTQAIGGLEYDGGCWAFRVVGQQLATINQRSNTAIFLQLELNGLTSVGSSPLDLLRRNIPGYGIINVDPAQP